MKKLKDANKYIKDFNKVTGHTELVIKNGVIKQRKKKDK